MLVQVIKLSQVFSKLRCEQNRGALEPALMPRNNFYCSEKLFQVRVKRLSQQIDIYFLSENKNIVLPNKITGMLCNVLLITDGQGRVLHL